MSEYTCSNGHLMKSGEYSCSICGARIGYEDGMSRSEMNKREMDEPECNEEDDDEEEEDDNE